MAAKISISIADKALLEWAKERAEQEGVSLSAIITDAVRRSRQYEARVRVEAWLGSAAKLTPAREAEIRAELGWDPPEGAHEKTTKKRAKVIRRR